ncbi:MAG: class I SAM-dependent methyltransferase [Propionibacteriaceae bacterium]|nr:class I SAM-dependent methyltransferase [Propionibacteriaceae bacterium]
MTSEAHQTAAQASRVYAEHFITEGDAARQARAAAGRLGLTAVTSGAAQTLTVLARLIAAKAAVEIGTGAGVASLALLQGMDPQGILTSIDSEADHQQAARSILAQAGYRPRLIAGRALEVLPRLSDGAYDIVFADAEPLEAGEYVEQALRLLRSGGVFALYHALLDDTVAQLDNLDDETLIVRETLEAVRDMDGVLPVLLPIGDGLLVLVKA